MLYISLLALFLVLFNCQITQVSRESFCALSLYTIKIKKIVIYMQKKKKINQFLHFF